MFTDPIDMFVTLVIGSGFLMMIVVWWDRRLTRRGSLRPYDEWVHPKYHQRQLVDGSSPFYQQSLSLFDKYHQRQLVDGSSPFHSDGLKKNPASAI
ncbi:MAG TPA: hypothetical protein VKB46_05710 [Pyrinomonadaceae bacterium]|nr:hypothetical protein [Pyrinomonadaceae bacterium]